MESQIAVYRESTPSENVLPPAGDRYDGSFPSRKNAMAVLTCGHRRQRTGDLEMPGTRNQDSTHLISGLCRGLDIRVDKRQRHEVLMRPHHDHFGIAKGNSVIADACANRSGTAAGVPPSSEVMTVSPHRASYPGILAVMSTGPARSTTSRTDSGSSSLVLGRRWRAAVHIAGMPVAVTDYLIGASLSVSFSCLRAPARMFRSE